MFCTYQIAEQQIHDMLIYFHNKWSTYSWKIVILPVHKTSYQYETICISSVFIFVFKGVLHNLLSHALQLYNVCLFSIIRVFADFLYSES